MVCLSFDTEEFDVPREHGVEYTLAQGLPVSAEGAGRILDILKENNVRATFFCTTNFALNAPEVMARIIAGGHEVACHGCDHFDPRPSDVRDSKRLIEEKYGVECHGYRQPRMFPVSDEEIRKCGYLYNSSLNPAFIPGRYMHLDCPRTMFMKDGVVQIPASVTPWLRIPLFWLALHNFPLWMYKWMVLRTLKHDGYFNSYFHPWEFYDIAEHPEYKLPWIIRHNSGRAHCKRLDSVIKYLLAHGAEFSTYSELAKLCDKDLRK